MSGPLHFEFNVSIHIDGGEGLVHVLWPCDASQIHQFLKKHYDLAGPERYSWEGISVSCPELDAKTGRPTALIALRTWDASADKFALLAHECFHAAEWMLKQTGHKPPINWMDLPPEGGPKNAWEDAAYLLQRIMRRVLDGIMSSPSSPVPLKT